MDWNHSSIAKRLLIYSAPIYIAFLIVYSPTIFTHYFFHDDSLLYSELYAYPPSHWLESPGFIGSLRGGRPITAMAITTLALSLQRTSNQDLFFVVLRLFNTLMLATACLLLTVWLSFRTREKGWFALCLGLMLFFLPGYELPAATASPAANTFVFPLVLAGTWCLGVQQPICGTWEAFANRRVLLRLGGAVLLLLITLFAYQLYTLFFLIPTLALVLLDQSVRNRGRIAAVASHLLVYLTSLGIYWVIFKKVMLPLAFHLSSHPELLVGPEREDSYPLSAALFRSNIGKLFSGFFWNRTGDLWIVAPDRVMAGYIYGLVAVSVLAFLIHWASRTRSGKDEETLDRVTAVRLAALLVVLYLGINVTNLRFEPNWSYRGTASYASMVVLLLVWSVQFWTGFLSQPLRRVALLVLLSAATIFAGWMAQYNTMQYFALPRARELAILEARLEPFLLGRERELIIRSPKGQDIPGDEFSRLNAASGPDEIKGILKYLHWKFGLSYSNRSITVSQETPWRVRLVDNANQANNQSDTLDLRQFQLTRDSKEELSHELAAAPVSPPINADQPPSGFKSLTVSRVTGAHHVAMAFDGSADANSFWEVAGPFPITVTLEWKQPAVLRGYVFLGGEAVDRMPREWTIEGSMDGNAWQVLDHRVLSAPWRPGQSQTFGIATPRPVRLLRLEFTGGFSPDIMRLYDVKLLTR